MTPEELAAIEARLGAMTIALGGTIWTDHGQSTDIRALLAEVKRLNELLDAAKTRVTELRQASRVLSENEGKLHARIADLETQLLHRSRDEVT